MNGRIDKTDLAILRRMPLAICPEQELVVELIDQKPLESADKTYVSDGDQGGKAVSMSWQQEGSINWFDGDSTACLATNRQKLKINIDGTRVVSVEVGN